MKIKGKNSIVLLTNYHVVIDGLTPESEYVGAKAKDIDSLKKEIEQNAKKCTILLLQKEVKLSNRMLIGRSMLSPFTSVSCYLYAHVQYIKLLNLCINNTNVHTYAPLILSNIIA